MVPRGVGCVDCFWQGRRLVDLLGLGIGAGRASPNSLPCPVPKPEREHMAVLNPHLSIGRGRERERERERGKVGKGEVLQSEWHEVGSASAGNMPAAQQRSTHGRKCGLRFCGVCRLQELFRLLRFRVFVGSGVSQEAGLGPQFQFEVVELPVLERSDSCIDS